jgi:hypothetical protein
VIYSEEEDEERDAGVQGEVQGADGRMRENEGDVIEEDVGEVVLDEESEEDDEDDDEEDALAVTDQPFMAGFRDLKAVSDIDHEVWDQVTHAEVDVDRFEIVFSIDEYGRRLFQPFNSLVGDQRRDSIHHPMLVLTLRDGCYSQ